MSRHRQDEDTVEGLRAQVEQLTAALTAALAQRDQMLTAYQPAADGSTGPIAQVSGPRGGAKAAHRTPREARWLRVVPAFVLVGLHGVRHAHWAAKVAAGVVTTGAVTTAAVVVAPHSPIAQAFGATPVASAPADGISSVTPFASPSAPASLRLIGALTRPGRLDAKTASGLPPATAVPAPAYQPPDSSPPSQQAQAQPPGGPAVLQVPVTGIDLTSGTPQQVQLSATGSGWVSWKVSTTGSDLDFSPSSGVLKAGDGVTLTVSVDRAQAQDRNTTAVFDVNGQQITVTLPVLAAPTAPAPAIPAATDPAPTDTTLPSPAAS